MVCVEPEPQSAERRHAPDPQPRGEHLVVLSPSPLAACLRSGYVASICNLRKLKAI